MSDVRIEILLDSEEGFKKGMRELKEQMSYLSSLKNEIDAVYNGLLQTQYQALFEYCSLNRELQSVIEWIPEHIAKK